MNRYIYRLYISAPVLKTKETWEYNFLTTFRHSVLCLERKHQSKFWIRPNAL